MFSLRRYITVIFFCCGRHCDFFCCGCLCDFFAVVVAANFVVVASTVNFDSGVVVAVNVSVVVVSTANFLLWLSLRILLN